MELLDRTQDVGPETWRVMLAASTASGPRRGLVVTAHQLWLGPGGALVARSGDGTLVLALAPGAWEKVERGSAEVPEGAQVYARG